MSVLVEVLRRVLAGIDETEDENGWWPTSTGAEFGAERLRVLEAELLTHLRAVAADEGVREAMRSAVCRQASEHVDPRIPVLAANQVHRHAFEASAALAVLDTFLEALEGRSEAAGPAEPHRHAMGQPCFPTCPGWDTPAPNGRSYAPAPEADR